MQYDPIGHVTQDLDPLSHATNYTYDSSNGSLASVTDPLTNLTQYQTDPLSRVTQLTDPTGKATKYQYDAAGDLTKVTDALNHDTLYAYDPGRSTKLLRMVTDANGHATTFGYDDQGRVTSVTDALGRTKTTTYDAKGNITQTQNARGQMISYTYDSADRLTRKTLPEGQINYTYDAAGNTTRITHYNGSSIQNAYDALNRLTQQIQTLPNGYAATLNYTYDAAGNRTSMGTPWGSFSYQYDANNRLIKITNPQGKVFTFAYDAAGRRTKLTYPNGITTVYAYDDANRVTSIVATRNSDGVVVSSEAYTYNAAGDRTSMTDLEGTHVYSYDDLHRLISAIHQDMAHEAFAYDGVGNRKSDAGISDYQYDAANRFTQSSSFTYIYDADGSLTGQTNIATQAHSSFAYNSLNELVQATTTNLSVSFEYDAAGNRVGKSVDGADYQYVYDGNQELAVMDVNGNLTSLFTNGPGLSQHLVMRRSAADYFYHPDALGSVVALTDNNGNLVESYEYTAFGWPKVKDSQGNEMGQQSAVGNSFLFAGAEWDAETRLYHMGARFLDPAAGRWTQEDPLGLNAGDVNLYDYVANNPLRFRDPLGLSLETDFGIDQKKFSDCMKKSALTLLGVHGLIFTVEFYGIEALAAGTGTLGFVDTTLFLGEALLCAHESRIDEPKVNACSVPNFKNPPTPK